MDTFLETPGDFSKFFFGPPKSSQCMTAHRILGGNIAPKKTTKETPGLSKGLHGNLGLVIAGQVSSTFTPDPSPSGETLVAMPQAATY